MLNFFEDTTHHNETSICTQEFKLFADVTLSISSNIFKYLKQLYVLSQSKRLYGGAYGSFGLHICIWFDLFGKEKLGQMRFKSNEVPWDTFPVTVVYWISFAA